MERIIDLAARSIQSDYDLAELLVGAMASQGPAAVVGNAFGAACAAIDSDYDLRRVLVEAVKHAKEPPPVERALGCAKGIGSDYDRAELLTAVVARWPRGRALSEQFYTLARGVSSDYDRRRSLQAAAERRPLRRRPAPAARQRRRLQLRLRPRRAAGTVGGAASFDGELATAFERAARTSQLLRPQARPRSHRPRRLSPALPPRGSARAPWRTSAATIPRGAAARVGGPRASAER